MSFNMLPEVDSSGLKNFPCFSGEGTHLIFGVAGAFEKSSREMFSNIWRVIRDNEMMNPAFRHLGGMIDSVNIVSVDTQAIMNGWESSIKANCNDITFIGDANGEFTRKMGMGSVFADGTTRSWFWCAMISDGFFDVWTPAKGFRDGVELSELENSDTVFKTFRSFHNETRNFIDELFEEEELKSVAGK